MSSTAARRWLPLMHRPGEQCSLVLQRLVCSVTTTSSAAILFFSVHRHFCRFHAVQALILIRPTSISFSHYKADQRVVKGKAATAETWAFWRTYFPHLSFSAFQLHRWRSAIVYNLAVPLVGFWSGLLLVSLGHYYNNHYIGWWPIVARKLLSLPSTNSFESN